MELIRQALAARVSALRRLFVGCAMDHVEPSGPATWWAARMAGTRRPRRSSECGPLSCTFASCAGSAHGFRGGRRQDLDPTMFLLALFVQR